MGMGQLSAVAGHRGDAGGLLHVFPDYGIILEKVMATVV